jgi:hypothetical protein
MQNLTEVVPHPVTTTFVPAGTAALSKVMAITLELPTKGGLT